MNSLAKSSCVVLVTLLSGCAHLDFGDDRGLTYFDLKPYLFVSTTKECVSVATVVSVPETKREVKFKSGYGTADLSVGLSNGMITSVGQKTDTKIPETITAIASLGTAAKGMLALDAASSSGKKDNTPASEKKDAAGTQTVCEPTAKLYPIENGIPKNIAISFDVPTKVIQK